MNTGYNGSAAASPCVAGTLALPISVMTNAGARVVTSSLSSDSSIIPENTYGIQEGTPLPFVNVLQGAIMTDGVTPIIAVASERSYYAGNSGNNQGDAMWNLFLDGVGEQNGSS